MLSLVFWALTFVVSIEYLTFIILRADNHGEGGILALRALVPDAITKSKKRGGPSFTVLLVLLVLLVIFGAALLYGDGVITPAISVLSAMERLEVATRAFTPAIVPLTVLILLGLFLVQRRGTAGPGRVFGPLTVHHAQAGRLRRRRLRRLHRRAPLAELRAAPGAGSVDRAHPRLRRERLRRAPLVRERHLL